MPDVDPALDIGLQRDILVSRIGENPSQPADASDAFFDEVHRLCRRAMAAGGNLPEGAIAFVLSENGIEVDPVFDIHYDSFAASGRFDQDRNALTTLGPVVLATRNLRVTYSTTCEVRDAAGVAVRLQALGLGSRPTALFLPGERVLMLYRIGVDQKATTSAPIGEMANLDPADLEGVLDFFHERWTRYPTGYGACWDNAGSRIVERNAERNVRNHLFLFLGMVVYRSPYVVREYDRPNGRVDVFVYGQAIGQSQENRILELKILRSRSSRWNAGGGTTKSYGEPLNKRYVEKGLRQAKRYLTVTPGSVAYLLCFDARLPDAEVDVHVMANTLGVQYRRYRMESTVTEA